MHITVRLFAIQRAQTGLRSLDLDLPDGASVASAWAALTDRHPQLASAGDSVRFARNSAYVDDSEFLADGDELAVIPPVSGGAVDAPDDAASAAYRRLEIHPEPFDADIETTLRHEVATASDGAVALFIGQTRRTPGTPAPGQEAEAARHAGRSVEGLSYEAFEPMALDVLVAIADEIADRFSVSRIAILHRAGEVGVGEASVVIAAASPHRAESFDACRYAIEELKARAPIWKAERFADGSVWMGAPPRPGPEHDA